MMIPYQLYKISIKEVSGGASENVNVAFETEYEFLFWYTPLMKTAVTLPKTANPTVDPVPV
jgi:hypothetical protein